MLWFFKRRQKKEQAVLFQNGSALLEELIASFNGRQEIPISCFTSKQIITATANFTESFTPFGFIYKGSINGRQILVKWLRYEGFNAIKDIAITSQMSHLKNVLKLSGCCLEFKNPVLVYQYVEFEPFSNFCYKHCYDDSLLAWRKRIQIAIGVANAILCLHTAFETPTIYRNLCPSRIIVDQYGVAKLFDFSFSISLPRGKSQVEDGVFGTWGFIDPEYLASGIVTEKVDVYGFGVLLILLVTGKKSEFNNFEDEIHMMDSIRMVDYVKDCTQDCIDKDQFSQIIDSKIIKEGLDQDKQLRAILDLAVRCTHNSGGGRPDMIDVAKQLCQIEKCFHY